MELITLKVCSKLDLYLLLPSSICFFLYISPPCFSSLIQRQLRLNVSAGHSKLWRHLVKRPKEKLGKVISAIANRMWLPLALWRSRSHCRWRCRCHCLRLQLQQWSESNATKFLISSEVIPPNYSLLPLHTHFLPCFVYFHLSGLIAVAANEQ